MKFLLISWILLILHCFLTILNQSLTILNQSRMKLLLWIKVFNHFLFVLLMISLTTVLTMTHYGLTGWDKWQSLSEIFRCNKESIFFEWNLYLIWVRLKLVFKICLIFTILSIQIWILVGLYPDNLLS